VSRFLSGYDCVPEGRRGVQARVGLLLVTGGGGDEEYQYVEGDTERLYDGEDARRFH